METIVWMEVTSADLLEMYKKAMELEKTTTTGDSLLIKEWSCGNVGTHHVSVKVMVDQERAQDKGLMK